MKDGVKIVGDVAKDVIVDSAHAKAADKLDTADKIVNNPLTKIVAGLIGPEYEKAIKDAGAKIK